jgi:hypothetical protein
MSYCRWSSDDFQCDVYCYASSDGYITHVASRRYVFTEPLPPDIDLMVNPEGWTKRTQQVMAMLDPNSMKPIGLPSDGKTFTDPDAESAAQTLLRLLAEGYRVPQYAIDALLEEAE